MVQRENPTRPGEFFPSSRDSNWHMERNFFDPTQQDGRFAAPQQPAQIHPRPSTIEAALRDCAGLPVRDFALIVQLEDGVEKTYTSQALALCHPRIFSDRFRQDFRRSIRRTASEASYSGFGYQEGGNTFTDFDTEDIRRFSSSGESPTERRGRHQYTRQPRSDESDDTDSGKGKRKRVRDQHYSSFDNDDASVLVPVVKTRQLIIGNEAEVEKFYYDRFKDMQQSACKVMGKAFVKLVEPKKQTHHPYTKGDDKAPPWWPKTTGENHVRHREPDHLYRPERIRLLVHILKLVIEPYLKQHPSVQKAGLNVQKLEEVTMEQMSPWFNDVEHPGNLAKKSFLKEIFKVAKAEQRYKNGELDRDTRIPVIHGDRGARDVSDDEIEEGVKDEDEEIESSSMPTSMPTPESLVSPSMLQTQHIQQSQEQEPNGMYMGSTRPLPYRYNTQPALEESSSYSTFSSVPRAIGVDFQSQSTNTQDPNRRSFVPSIYTSPQSMYGWQNTTLTTNSGMNSNYYVTSPQTPLSAHNSQFQLPPPSTQQPMLPPMLQSHYDGLPSTRQFDSSPAAGNIVRTGSLGHPHHVPHGYPNYLNEVNYGHSDGRDEHQQIHHN